MTYDDYLSLFFLVGTWWVIAMSFWQPYWIKEFLKAGIRGLPMPVLGIMFMTGVLSRWDSAWPPWRLPLVLGALAGSSFMILRWILWRIQDLRASKQEET